MSDAVQRNNFQILAWDKVKMCVFQGKIVHISETVRDRARLLLITNRKSHMPFRMR